MWRYLLGLWGCTMGLYLQLYPSFKHSMVFFVIDCKTHHLMCINTYSLSCIHFLLWTLIDSFVWNEIVHGIYFGINGWYHQYDAYSTPARRSRVTFCVFPGLLGVACSPILSVSIEGMGYAPVLNLSATPNEAVSIICTVVDKTYF